mmetsp:Transcript_17906/g.24948  ORF Transcript_17906/g.24948 Transcript_17906/m.24948 type:complete len:137 (-) Transcript_17906:118-528(-)
MERNLILFLHTLTQNNSKRSTEEAILMFTILKISTRRKKKHGRKSILMMKRKTRCLTPTNFRVCYLLPILKIDRRVKQTKIVEFLFMLTQNSLDGDLLVLAGDGGKKELLVVGVFAIIDSNFAVVQIPDLVTHHAD